jgi:hypothetical protein
MRPADIALRRTCTMTASVGRPSVSLRLRSSTIQTDPGRAACYPRSRATIWANWARQSRKSILHEPIASAGDVTIVLWVFRSGGRHRSRIGSLDKDH